MLFQGGKLLNQSINQDALLLLLRDQHLDQQEQVRLQLERLGIDVCGLAGAWQHDTGLHPLGTERLGAPPCSYLWSGMAAGSGQRRGNAPYGVGLALLRTAEIGSTRLNSSH